MACIVANTLVLCLKWYNEPEELQDITDILNYIFAFIFTLEIVLKLIAFGKMFWSDGWNNLDLAIVIGTLVGIVL